MGDNLHRVRPGRPTSIDKPATDAVGNPTTVADGIVSRIRAGAYLETACAAVDVHSHTAHKWMRTGTNARKRILAGAVEYDDLTPLEQQCIDFATGIEKAEADWQMRAEAQLEVLCRGGSTIRTVTVRKDPKGGVIETIEKTEHIPPDPKVIMWRLERRHPDLYGRRTVQEVKVGGNPAQPIEVNVDADGLMAKLQAIAAGAAPDVIDADSYEDADLLELDAAAGG